MRRITKTISCFLTCVIAALFLLSCQSVEPIESSDEEKRVVGVIGGYEVRFEELRFAAHSYISSLVEKYGEGVLSEPDIEKRVRERVYAGMTYNYAILKMCEEARIDVNNELILEAVQSDIEQISDELGGFSDYREYLSENMLTDSLMRFNAKVDIIKNELFYVYTQDVGLIETDDEKIYDIISDEFIVTQHIFIPKGDGAYGKAEMALSELKSGADFLAVAKKYNKDDTQTSDGEYIVAGYMSDAYEYDAFMLDVGEYSDIVEDESGYLIIKRIEQNPMYVMINFSTLKDRYQQYKFLELIEEVQKELKFTPNEYGSGLDILNLK